MRGRGKNNLGNKKGLPREDTIQTIKADKNHRLFNRPRKASKQLPVTPETAAKESTEYIDPHTAVVDSKALRAIMIQGSNVFNTWRNNLPAKLVIKNEHFDSSFDFSRFDLHDTLFEFCTFDGVEFNETILDDAMIAQCEFDNCEFDNIEITYGQGPSLRENKFNNVSFNNCDLKDVFFTHNKCKRFSLYACSFEEGGISNCDFIDFKWTGQRWNGGIFTENNFKKGHVLRGFTMQDLAIHDNAFEDVDFTKLQSTAALDGIPFKAQTVNFHSDHSDFTNCKFNIQSYSDPINGSLMETEFMKRNKMATWFNDAGEEVDLAKYLKSKWKKLLGL